VTYDKVPDEVLKQISEGNGHAYRHEAKSMARELAEYRAKERAGTQPAPHQHNWIPYP
jgi:hypothetical protein